MESDRGVKMSPPPPPFLLPRAWMCVRACSLQDWGLFLITGRDLVIKTRANSPPSPPGARSSDGNKRASVGRQTRKHHFHPSPPPIKSLPGTLACAHRLELLIQEDSPWGVGGLFIKHLLEAPPWREIWDGSWADQIRGQCGTPIF